MLVFNILFTQILTFFFYSSSAKAEELFIFNQTHHSPAKKFSFALESTFTKSEIDYKESNKEFDKDFYFLTTGFGFSYNYNNRHFLYTSIELNRELDNPEYSETILNDPVFSYWYRTSNVYHSLDFSDIGFEITPRLFKEHINKKSSGHQLSAKYRFGFLEKNQNAYATYYMGLQEGRGFNDKYGIRRKVNFMTFLGLDMLYQYFLSSKTSIGGKFNLRYNSRHPDKIHYPSASDTSSWLGEYNIFISQSIVEKAKILLNYQSLSQSIFFNKLSSQREGIDRENQSIMLSFYVEN